VSPPARRSAQADEAGGLGGNAVRGHELLLLAHRVEKPERVHAEADNAHQRDREQAAAGAQGDGRALASLRGCEHQERQQQRSGHLDGDASGQRQRRGAQTWAGAGAEKQREREREQYQRVVVSPTDGEREQHRVQPDERGGPARRAPDASCGEGDQRDRGEAREHSHGFEHPQPCRESQGSERVAGEREQRPVRRVLKRPADETEDRVCGRFGGDVGVRVESVQRAHAREREVAEDVLGDQWRPQQQDHVGDHDRRRDRHERKPLGGHEHERVARAHQQHQRLEARAGKPDVQATQRAGKPRRPAADASGHVLRRRRCRPGAQQRDGRDDANQPERTEHLHRECRGSAALGVGVPRPSARARRGRYRGRRLHCAHCYVSPTCGRPLRSITSTGALPDGGLHRGRRPLQVGQSRRSRHHATSQEQTHPKWAH
jgi:hypothetical protein